MSCDLQKDRERCCTSNVQLALRQTPTHTKAIWQVQKKKDEKKDLTYLYSSSLISLGEIPTRQLTLNNINQTVFCFD